MRCNMAPKQSTRPPAEPPINQPILPVQYSAWLSPTCQLYCIRSYRHSVTQYIWLKGVTLRENSRVWFVWIVELTTEVTFLQGVHIWGIIRSRLIQRIPRSVVPSLHLLQMSSPESLIVQLMVGTLRGLNTRTSAPAQKSRWKGI